MRGRRRRAMQLCGETGALFGEEAERGVEVAERRHRVVRDALCELSGLQEVVVLVLVLAVIFFIFIFVVVVYFFFSEFRFRWLLGCCEELRIGVR